MTRADENKLRVELEQAINECLDSTEIALPWVGDNICEIMAAAALQVMLGIADAQKYLEREEMLITEVA